MSFVIVLAVVLGASICLQGVVNGRLSERIGLPLTLTITAGVAFVGAFLWYLLSRALASRASDHVAGGPDTPWSWYTGGLFGLLILSSAAVAYPRLGAAPTTAIAVASQLLFALVLDQVGATGRTLPLTPLRIAGVVLLVAGVLLLVGFDGRRSPSGP